MFRSFLPLSVASLIINDKILSSRNCTSSAYASSFFSLSSPGRFMPKMASCRSSDRIWSIVRKIVLLSPRYI